MKESRILLSAEQISLILNIPETGMGYHLVNVYLKDGQVLNNQLVLNSSILVIKAVDKLTLNDIERIKSSTNY